MSTILIKNINNHIIIKLIVFQKQILELLVVIKEQNIKILTLI